MHVEGAGVALAYEENGDGRSDGPLIGRRSLWAPIRTRIPWPPR